VAGTAIRKSGTTNGFSPLKAFIAVRRARSALAATILCGALSSWLGLYNTSLPTVDNARTIIPLWRLLALAAAVPPIVSLHSQLADLEVVSSRVLRLYQRTYLAGMSFTCALIYLGISALTLPPEILVVIARSLLAWSGLALVAGVLLGWRLAWTLPITVAVVLWYWGYAGNDHYRWWEFSARPYTDVPSLIVSLALLAVGMVAYWATPWRRKRLSWRRRQNPR
jgi:hypothetical protein